MSLFTLAMRLARTPPGRALTRFLFAKMTFALAVARLRETPALFAFKHPIPKSRFPINKFPCTIPSPSSILAPNTRN